MRRLVQHVVARAVHDPRFARVDPVRAAAGLADVRVRLFEAADVDGGRAAHLNAKALMSARESRAASRVPATIAETASSGVRPPDASR